MTTASRFERDSAVTRIDPQRFTALVDDGWLVIDGAAANGGYLMAIGARAMAQACERPDPVTITTHFLSPPTPGPIDITVEVVRQGGRHATVAAALRQDDRQLARMLATFGDLSTSDGPTHVSLRPPDLPPISGCVDTVAMADQAHAEGRAPAPAPILQRFDHRQPARHLAWTRGEGLGHAVNGGYIRWPDAPAVDPFGLLVVADCYPPAVFNLGAGLPVGWAPTIELTVQVRARPAAGWLRTRFTTDALTNGYLEEDGAIWDETGVLVALSRQTAMVGRPR